MKYTMERDALPIRFSSFLGEKKQLFLSGWKVCMDVFKIYTPL